MAVVSICGGVLWVPSVVAVVAFMAEFGGRLLLNESILSLGPALECWSIASWLPSLDVNSLVVITSALWLPSTSEHWSALVKPL
eukprot:6432497-Karenia_brevis.AAC.1